MSIPARSNGPTCRPRFATIVAVPSPPPADAAGHDLTRRLSQFLAGRPSQVVTEWEAHPAAVLVPLFQDQGEWHVLYTRRIESVDAHPGQVSFPGGRIEEGDAGPQQAALREAEEEIGLRPGDVHVLGVLDSLLTVTQYRVAPVVAAMPWPYAMALNEHEVASVFSVPIRWLLDSANLEARPRPPASSGRHPTVYYFQPYQGEVIWGVTARITVQLLEALKESEP